MGSSGSPHMRRLDVPRTGPSNSVLRQPGYLACYNLRLARFQSGVDMKSKEKAKNEWDFLGIKTDRISWYASILAYFAIALTLAVYLFKFGPASGFSLSSQQSVWAEFGDFFSGTAGPFIGFASIMLLVTTLHQQSKLLALQNFEQTFFRRLDGYQRQIDEFEFPVKLLKQHAKSETILRGRSALRQAALFAFKGSDERECVSADQVKPLLKKDWDALYMSRSDWLGRILRTLYGIYEWIDASDLLTVDQQWEYCRIVRAQLSDAELYLLFANGYSEAGLPFKRYIEKYALFDNMNISPSLGSLQYLLEHENIYAESAFSSEQAKLNSQRR
jgi:hypothetical protein